MVSPIVSARARADPISRERDPDEAWRIAGSGTLPPRSGRSCARSGNGVIAKRGGRSAIISYPAKQRHDRGGETICRGRTPEFRHMSDRRRKGFLAAAQAALELPESAWPQRPARVSRTRTPGFDKKVEELRRRRDHTRRSWRSNPPSSRRAATLEGIAADPSRSETLLVVATRPAHCDSLRRLPIAFYFA